MNKIEIVSKALNIILGVIYIPISFFSWLFMMASETTISQTNTIYISLMQIFGFVAFLIPFLCLAGVIVSASLRKKGEFVWSLIALFVPLVTFILNMCLLFFAESLI